MTARDTTHDIPDHDCPRDAGTGIWCDVHVAYDRGRAAGAAEERQRIRPVLADAIELAEEAIPYAGDYFRDKWQLDFRLEEIKNRADLLDGAS